MILENELLQLALGMAQAVLLLLCAPLVTGIVKKVKAWMQNRIGSSIWQEYYDIRKWWGKPTMLTPYTSITFRLAPCVYFLTTFAAACMLPGFLGGWRRFCICISAGLGTLLYGSFLDGCSHRLRRYGRQP